MRVKFMVTVTDDDTGASKTASSELQLPVNIEGADPDMAKRDFLAQAESLVRSICENQLPALYSSVEAASTLLREEEAEKKEQSAREKVKARLNKLHAKKEKQKKQPDETDDDMVKCTVCGAEIKRESAHFVSLVNDGKYVGDGITCDACFAQAMQEPGDGEDGQ